MLSTQEIPFTLIWLCLISDVSTNKLYNKRTETFHLFFLVTSTDQTVLWHHAMLNRLSNLQDRRGSESERDLAVLEEKFEGYAASEGVCFQRWLSAESSGMFFIKHSDLKPWPAQAKELPLTPETLRRTWQHDCNMPFVLSVSFSVKTQCDHIQTIHIFSLSVGYALDTYSSCLFSNFEQTLLARFAGMVSLQPNGICICKYHLDMQRGTKLANYSSSEKHEG